MNPITRKAIEDVAKLLAAAGWGEREAAGDGSEGQSERAESLPTQPSAEDNLVDNLLQSNTAFQAKVAKSKSGPRKPFTPGGSG